MVRSTARLAQSVEREALNLVVVGSSPTVGVLRSKLAGDAFARTGFVHRQSTQSDLHPQRRRPGKIAAALQGLCTGVVSRRTPETCKQTRYSVAGWDIHPPPERPGFESR